jgi:hypothetical protein
MLLDMDGLKQINDGHGHAAGDATLMEFAARLRQTVAPAGAWPAWAATSSPCAAACGGEDDISPWSSGCAGLAPPLRWREGCAALSASWGVRRARARPGRSTR